MEKKLCYWAKRSILDVVLTMNGHIIGNVLKPKNPQMNNCNWRWSISIPGEPPSTIGGVPGMEYIEAGYLPSRDDAMRRVEKYLGQFGYYVLTKREIALL